MSNSAMVSYTNLSPNKHSPRNHKIDTITIHCAVTQATAAQICNSFSKPARGASCNYAIGRDGDVALCVPECDRSWCSSSPSNDNRAITIEVASDVTHPYAITDKAYRALVMLCADICRRNNIPELKWIGDKNLIGQVEKQNMTVHRWFANKACPGDYIYERLGKIAAAVNNELNVSVPPKDETIVNGKEGVATVKVDDLNYREGPGMEFAVKGVTGKGVFTIVEIVDGWGKLKSGAGWIWLNNPEYVEFTSSDKAPAPDVNSGFKVRVTADHLNIRSGPGTNNPVVQVIEKGVFTIVQTEKGAGSNSGWGKLKSGVGWISLDFTEKV